MAEHQEESPEIQTFVFLDLETSGFDIMTRILELSMIAVSRNDLLNMKPNKTLSNNENASSTKVIKNNTLTHPRVLHKFSRLYYPRRIIPPILEEITGLTNENLHHLPPFNGDSASSIKTFLEFPGPVCLIAHNGNSFDFPILKAELLNAASDSLKVLCADSLIFARHYEAENVKLLTELAKDFEDSDFMDIQSYSNPQPCTSSVNNNNLQENDTFMQSDFMKNMLPSGKDIFITPEKLSSNNLSQTHLKTPQKRPFPSDKVTPEHTSNGILRLNGTKINKKVKRALYYNERPAVRRTPFSQPILYYRLFRKEYNAHRAEFDAMALMEICGFHGEEFANWADKNFTSFEAVKPRWKGRVSFNL